MWLAVEHLYEVAAGRIDLPQGRLIPGQGIRVFNAKSNSVDDTEHLFLRGVVAMHLAKMEN
jgi:hypothetical protein